MSFGEMLQRLRTERDMSKYALEKASGVPHANIGQFESGRRGVPTVRTVFDLALGLGLDGGARRDLLELALGERFFEELERFAIYYYLALVGDDEVERVNRYIHERMAAEQHIIEKLTRHGVRGHEPVLYDLLVAIAEMPELAHLRRQLAAEIIKTVTADLEYGTVNLRPGAVAADLLARQHAEAPERAGTHTVAVRGQR